VIRRPQVLVRTPVAVKLALHLATLAVTQFGIQRDEFLSSRWAGTSAAPVSNRGVMDQLPQHYPGTGGADKD
jgi:hypothetical protein